MALVGIFIICRAFSAEAASPTNLPSSTDAGRIAPQVVSPASRKEAPAFNAPPAPTIKAPETSKSVLFVLRDVKITGMTVFGTANMNDIYAAHIGSRTTLDKAWDWASEITSRYRKGGYFLSHAYVPAQEVKNGVVTLHVAEGFISDVTIDAKEVAANSIVQEWVAKIRTYRPITSAQLENALLQLNALPGNSFRAVLEPSTAKNAPEGAAILNLIATKEKTTASITFDNTQSKYLGPDQATARYEASIIPSQRTKIALISAMPTKKLAYASVTQEIPVMAGGMLDVFGNATRSQPGYKLTPEEVKSDSLGLGAGFTYQWHKERDHALSSRIGIESRDTNTDILGSPQTRDSIRVVRVNTAYQVTDAWQGSDYGVVTFSQGIGVFGASRSGDSLLSRSEATPDFRKLELYLSRLQTITSSWNALISASGQLASGPLYSSEQFGYGGQAFGRAYDASELTGDHGIDAAIEMRYNGIDPIENMRLMPYGFYDMGRVWNENAGIDHDMSGASVGGGVRLLSDFGVTGDVGFAFPLWRDASTPLGRNGESPRYLMQISYGF